MAMEAAGRYNLAWTDFDQYTTTAFKDLGARREFVDVTLACEGDVQVQAHKVILAACSSFFRAVLLRNSHPHPLIYLDSIGPEQLEALVSFMYTGETNIPQGEFEDFMRAAKRYRVAGLMVDGEEEERVKQEQQNIFPLVPLEEIKKIKKKIKRETKVESRLEDTPVQSDVLTEVDVVEQEEDEEEEEEQEQDAKEEEEADEDEEEIDEADVLCKGEIVPEMNITMDTDAEDVADDEDEEEESEEMPESDVSNLFLNGEEGEEDEEEEGAGDIVSADTLDDMMSYDEDVNDEEEQQKEEDEEEGEEEEENNDDEEEEGEDEEDEEDPRDPDYEIEEDEEEDRVTIGETLKEETKVEPSEVFSEAITKVLIKSENENVNDLYKGNPILSIQKKRSGCRPSALFKVKLAQML